MIWVEGLFTEGREDIAAGKNQFTARETRQIAISQRLAMEIRLVGRMCIEFISRFYPTSH